MLFCDPVVLAPASPFEEVRRIGNGNTRSSTAESDSRRFHPRRRTLADLAFPIRDYAWTSRQLAEEHAHYATGETNIKQLQSVSPQAS